MAKVCFLLNRFIPSSKDTEILSLYNILPNFIKISQELFEIIDIKIYTHTDTQTHRHIHADENNTCTKNKVFGPGKYSKKLKKYYTPGPMCRRTHKSLVYWITSNFLTDRRLRRICSIFVRRQHLGPLLPVKNVFP